MSLETYLTFVFTSIALCIVPGPDMIHLLGRSIVQGRKAGMYTAFGINTGAYVHLTVAVLGLSAILATSSVAFTIVKWIGAAYLVYLGVSAILAKRSALVIESNALPHINNKAIFWQGFLSDVLNLKVALFYLAILPQFADPCATHPTVQLLVLGVSLNIVGIVINIIYVYFSSSLTERLRCNSRISTWLNKVLGSIFIALGLKLASEKQ
jgi:threonine/homoserine/homoserine lactone efflux protein